jgi:hypothetical protein
VAESRGRKAGWCRLLEDRPQAKLTTPEVANRACLFASRSAGGWIDSKTVLDITVRIRLINQPESVMNAVRHLVFIALGGLALSSAIAQGAPSLGNIKDPWGYAVPDNYAERTVTIDQGTRWVNVTRMETVRFVVKQGGAQKTFTWRFDGFPRRSFSLNDVAPAGVLGQQQVMVYVGPNRYLDGGGGGKR